MSPIPFIGLAPGMVGVYQINFILPEYTPSGITPVQLVRDQCTPKPAFSGCVPEFYPMGSQYLTYSQTVLLPVR